MMHNYRLRKSSCVLSLAGLLVALMPSNAAAETLEQAWAAALAADHGLKASRHNSAARVDSWRRRKLPVCLLWK